MAESVKSKGWVKSKYLKDPRERVIFYRCGVVYLFALYVMPQYFGIPNPVFDLTIVRMCIIALLILIVFDYDRSVAFVDLIKKEKLTRVLLPYFIVISYTMVLRADINAFLNPFIEFLELYLMIYVIRDSVGVDKTVDLVLGFIYLLVILGIYEAIVQESPFAHLVTIRGIYTGRYIRGGNYRIMSNCAHSLGYGLLLVTALPFAGYDRKDNSFNIFRRPLLLFGIVVNIFLTGSRSSLGVMGAELFLMFVFSDRKKFRNNCIIAVSSLIAFVAVVFVIQGTPPGRYIMLQLTSLIDTLFHTSYSVKYGADISQLRSSSAYRDQLKGIYKLDWLNPILGIGRKRKFSSVVDGHVLISIDNFYIADFIRYAYPGEASFLFFIFYYGYRMLKDIYKTHSGLIRCLFVGAFTYCYHLKIADSLQTLKYLYVLLAIYICCDKTPFVPEDVGCRYIGKRKSRYVKK